MATHIGLQNIILDCFFKRPLKTSFYFTSVSVILNIVLLVKKNHKFWLKHGV